VKYRKKSALTEATQWFQDGDHPQVQVFKSIDELEALDPLTTAGDRFCPNCGNLMRRHGVLDGANGLEYICPSDYVVTDRDGNPYRVSRGEFESQYEPYVRPPSFAPVPDSDLEQRRSRRKREAP
jgi:hypothetical protein